MAACAPWSTTGASASSRAGPSDPVEVIGFDEVPDAGDLISAVDDDSLSRQVAEERKDKLRAALIKSQQKTTLDDLFSQISAGEIKDLNLIIKADVQGSVEAVRQSLEKLSNDEVRVRTHPRRRGRHYRNRRYAGFRVQRHHHRLQRASG